MSQSLAAECFYTVVKVKTPKTEDNCVNEYKSFMENYELPCGRAVDGFHVHVPTHLKNHLSFKNKYTITSMGLI